MSGAQDIDIEYCIWCIGALTVNFNITLNIIVIALESLEQADTELYSMCDIEQMDHIRYSRVFPLYLFPLIYFVA